MTTHFDDNTFAAACYNQNSIDELREALNGDADAQDCETWHLTPEQWRAEIETALAAKVEAESDDA